MVVVSLIWEVGSNKSKYRIVVHLSWRIYLKLSRGTTEYMENIYQTRCECRGDETQQFLTQGLTAHHFITSLVRAITSN